MSVENIIFDKNSDDIFHQDMMDYNFVQGVFGREDTNYVKGKELKSHRVPGENWDTKYGITYKAYSDNYSDALNKKVKNLTEDQAIQHYINKDLKNARYIWGGAGGSNAITYKLTDIGINAGPNTGTEIMQLAINDVINSQPVYENVKPLTVDGKWSKGGETDKYYKDILAVFGKKGEKALMEQIKYHQHRLYQGEKFKTKTISQEKANRYYWGQKGNPSEGDARGGWVDRANWDPLKIEEQ